VLEAFAFCLFFLLTHLSPAYRSPAAKAYGDGPQSGFSLLSVHLNRKVRRGGAEKRKVFSFFNNFSSLITHRSCLPNAIGRTSPAYCLLLTHHSLLTVYLLPLRYRSGQVLLFASCLSLAACSLQPGFLLPRRYRSGQVAYCFLLIPSLPSLSLSP
jgi:hypothetical protein